MNSKVNYTFVGLFVLASILAIFTFVLWLIEPTDQEEMTYYKINFTESVSGLNIDSPVKYRGVTIGQVKKMRINPANIETIEVLVLVEKDAPVKVDTVAKLKAQGITGLSFVDLSEGSKESACLVDISEEEIPEIKSIPSFLVRMEESFGSVSSNLMKTMQSLQHLMDSDNQERISRILEHTANTMERTERALDDATIEHFHQLVASADAVMQKLNVTIPKVDTFLDSSIKFENNISHSVDIMSNSIHSVSQSYLQLASSAKVFQERNENGDYSVKENLGAPMKQFELSMRELQQTMINLNEMLDKFGNSPSDMIFVHEEKVIGPGERE